MNNTLRDDPLAEGNLWSWVRSVMSQGADIRVDYDSGKFYASYEAYSARLSAAASERADQLRAAIDGYAPKGTEQ